MSTDYTVRLEQVFQGPMDLLLHLVREQEVEIQDVQIARVVDGFCAYVNALQDIDLEFAGEFVVMAATLMAIKSRSLLPKEEVDLEDDLDPGDELIQRLLEYRRFKESSEFLEDRFLERECLHERGWRGEVKDLAEEPELDLGELTAFDLLSSYSRLLRETQSDRPHVVGVDPRPLRFYVDTMVARVRTQPRTSLFELLDTVEGPRRESLVGSFCALLELCKLGLIRVEQGSGRDDIAIELVPESTDDIDAILADIGTLDDEDDAGGAPEALEADSANGTPAPEPAGPPA